MLIKLKRGARRRLPDLADVRPWEKDDRERMTIKRRTSISIETHRVLWLGNQRRTKLQCSECGQETNMVSLADATRFMTLDTNAIEHQIQARGMHLTQTADGVMVCLKSLEVSTSEISSRNR
jgi:hypothetical protein